MWQMVQKSIISAGISVLFLIMTFTFIERPSAIAADEVVFAFIDDLSGPSSDVGEDGRKGIVLALEHVGYKVLGKKIKLVVRDTELKADVGVRRFREVVEQERPVMVAGGCNTGVQLAMMQVAKETKTLFWSQGFGDAITAAGSVNRYVFRWDSTDYARANCALTGFLEKFPKAKTFFCITSDYVWGRGLFDMVKENVEKRGGKIVGNILTPLNETDYSGAVTKAIEAKPDVIVLNHFGAPLHKVARTAHEFGAKKYSKVLLPADGLTMLRGIGSEALEGMYVGLDWWHRLDNDFSRQFTAKFRKKYNMVPSFYAMCHYVSTVVTVKAMETVKSTDVNKVICALEGYKYDGPTGKEEIQAFDHQVPHRLYLGVGKSPKKKEYDDDYVEIIGSAAVYKTYEQNPVVWDLKLPCDKK